ncbi:MAG: VOC family protein, partial [Thermomicrobiales bacterium]
ILATEEQGEDVFPSTLPGAGAPRVVAPAAVETSPLERSWGTIPPVASVGADRAVEMRALNHVSLLVADVGRAERFYHDFLSMDIVGRARRDRHGALEALGSDYSWESAALAGAEADVTVMRNGPVVLALNRLGRGARLERGLLDHLSIRVDASTFTALKGQVLMRSMEVRAVSDSAFTFRDPFFVTWEITLQGVPDFIG